MNIFVLSLNPKKCAVYHCDKHVVKMIIEYTQILSTVQHIFGIEGPLKVTHKHHPCTIRVTESKANYLWLAELGIELCREYTRRYEKIHSFESVLKDLKKNAPKSLSTIPLTPFHQAMPDEFRHENSVIAYRTYYNKAKSKFAKWKNVKKPYWYKNEYIDGI